MKPTATVADAPTSLVWSDRVFSEKRDFAAWLRARGVRYKAWAANHPAARSILEPAAGRRLAKPAGTPTRESADDAAKAGESRQTMLAVGVVAASLLGILGLLMLVRSRAGSLVFALPRARLPRPRAPDPRPLPSFGLLTATRAWRPRFRSLGAQASGAARALRPLGGVALAVSIRRAAKDAETEPVSYDRLLLRHALKRHRPDLVLYATSTLLACVIGASIALYLK